MDEKEAEKIKDYKECFSTPGDMRVLADLAKRANLYYSLEHLDKQGRMDPFAVVREEGQRSVVMYIYRYLNKNPFEQRQRKAKGSV